MIFTNSTNALPNPTTELPPGHAVYLDPDDQQWKAGSTTEVLKRWPAAEPGRGSGPVPPL